MEHEIEGDTNCNWCAWYSHKSIRTGTGVLGNKRTSGTIQTTALLRSARVLGRVLETWGDLLSLRLQWKSSANVSVKNSLKRKNDIHIKSDVCVYAIQCLDSNKKYVVETSRKIRKLIYEHRRDLIKGNVNNSLVRCNLEINHNFNFKDFKMLVCIPNKKGGKIVKSSIIFNSNTMKQTLGFFNLSLYLVKLVQKVANFFIWNSLVSLIIYIYIYIYIYIRKYVTFFKNKFWTLIASQFWNRTSLMKINSWKLSHISLH